MACKSLSFDINLQTTPLFIQCLLLEMFKYIKEISCKWSKQTSNFSFPKNLPEPKKDYLEIATTKKMNYQLNNESNFYENKKSQIGAKKFF